MPLRTYKLFQYEPSPIAAGVFLGIFAITTIIHGWQIIRSRTWYFIPMFIACIMEVIGYFARILSSRDTTRLFPFILQNLFLLVAPAIYAATIYVILGRVIVLVKGEEYSIIRIDRLTKIFVGGDILSFLVQSAGGTLLAVADGDPAKMRNGERAILGGLAIQILFFAVFIVVIVIFHSRIHKRPTDTSKALLMDRDSESSSRLSHTWKTMVYVLYAASGLIMIRSVFRIAEFVTGHDGVLMRNEVWLYIFDGALMAIVSYLFNFVHPSRALITTSRGEYEMA